MHSLLLGGKDQFKMRQNIADFLYLNFLGRTSQKRHPVKQAILTFFQIQNLDGHLNCCIGSKVTAILLNGLILLTGGVVSGRVCPAACAAELFA